MVAGADLILDSALKGAGQDRFEHQAIAQVVAELALNATPPINIALFGPWGSGKSSFFGLLDERMRSLKTVKVARYDAWKYGGRALKKHFVGSIAAQVGHGGEDFEERLAHDKETVRLDLPGWVKKNWPSLLIGLGLALVVALVWFVLVSLAYWAVHRDGVADATKFAVTSVGTVLSLAFAALLIGPKALEPAIVKVTETAPQTDDEFAKSFQKLVDETIDVSKSERLIIFIDELDRCDAKDVVSTLIDLKTFLDVEGCVFIVAADREVLERALREVPQANPVRDEDPYYSTPGAFLDKIFQHQIPLPPLRPQALTRFARGLVEDQAGLWADLRSAQPEDRLFLSVVYAVIPVHVRSPRRVKVLLNNYATTVRVAEARGIDWLGRAAELACLTVLETEFPAVAADLIRIPRLLDYLRDGEPTDASEEVKRIVTAYRRTESEAGQIPFDVQAAGALLIDDHGSNGNVDRANKVINAHLLSYLRKIAAQGIPDPRPDLFYLQSAGFNEGIIDPELGYAIDFAADLAAEDVISAFANQPSATTSTAVRLLVQQAEAERGPGRTSIIEAACRLVETLDRDDLERIAPVAAGGVLADVDSPDWRREATPGALLLGVIGARADLVSRLLERDPADGLARDGLLARVTPLLAYASDSQAQLVHQLLAGAYLTYPTPLHDALTTLPINSAQQLLDVTRANIVEALDELASASTIPTPATATATAAGTATATTTSAPTETAAERYEALLKAVEARSDDDAEILISKILELGQTSDLADVRNEVRRLEDDAIERIDDPQRLNTHALLGIERAPIGDCAWWGDRLTDGNSDKPQAFNAFERLTKELSAASEDLASNIEIAATKIIRHFHHPDYGVDNVIVLKRALVATPWPDQDKTTVPQRATAYAIADAARPLSGDEAIDAMLVEDIVRGLDEFTGGAEYLPEARRRTSSLTVDAATRLEEDLASRGMTSTDLVPTLLLRIEAASLCKTIPFGADTVLTAAGLENEGTVLNRWLDLGPQLHEAQKALGQGIKVDTSTLCAYATQLNLDDRTTLWIDIYDRVEAGRTWTPGVFRLVGQAGIGSPAIERIAAAISAATQQSKRDDIMNRLLAAKLTEQPPHKTATDLVLQLLSTGVNGDADLAARLAIHSAGVAHGKTVTVRTAFDSVVTAKPNAISKSHQERLRKKPLALLSEPKKEKSRRRKIIDTVLGTDSND